MSEDYLDRGDNAWQLTAATLVGLQSIPGLMILYGGIVKKKWAVNSAFMVLYAFSAVLICWVGWGYKFAFGNQWFPLWGKPGPAVGASYYMSQAYLPAANITAAYPQATQIYFQFVFAAITLILIAGALLGRMNFLAWMLFVPLWFTFSYTIGAFSIWGGGFLFKWGVLDWAGGYVIHVSAGYAGFTAAAWVSSLSSILSSPFAYSSSPFCLSPFLRGEYSAVIRDIDGVTVVPFEKEAPLWPKTNSPLARKGPTLFLPVGPRLARDRERFPPNNILLVLAGAGMLWLGWNGFNGADADTRSTSPLTPQIAAVAVLNTNITCAFSILTWTACDILYFGKPSVIGAVQGLITGLVVITPGAGAYS
eukprot:SM002237S07036  [mRNA]  locus=s2237:328:1748:- [translate_table: standard]